MLSVVCLVRLKPDGFTKLVNAAPERSLREELRRCFFCVLLQIKKQERGKNTKWQKRQTNDNRCSVINDTLVSVSWAANAQNLLIYCLSNLYCLISQILCVLCDCYSALCLTIPFLSLCVCPRWIVPKGCRSGVQCVQSRHGSVWDGRFQTDSSHR